MNYVLSRQQREALRRVHQRHRKGMPYLAFRRTAVYHNLIECLMVPIPKANMWLGIERDGYTHS